jgi:copper chaperone CopZ
VSVSLKKIEGVASVTVSLKEASADIYLEPENKVTLPYLRRIVRSNGFQTKDAKVVAIGRLTGSAASLALDLLNGSSLPIAKAAVGARAPDDGSGAVVEITGISRADDRNTEKLTIDSIK